MNLEALLFATNATVENALLTIDRGGFEYWQVPSLPVTFTVYVAGVLTVDEDELEATAPLTLDASILGKAADPTPVVQGIAPRRDAPAPGVPARVPFAFPVQVRTDEPMVLRAALRSGDTPLGEITLDVRVAADERSRHGAN